MHKKITIAILLLIFSFILVACNKDINKLSLGEDAGSKMLGSWIIKRTVAFGKVSALSDEGINKLIGKRIKYSSNTANFGNKICKYPKYKKSRISEKDFFENNGYTSFKELGLQGDNVTMVEVFSEKEDYNNFWYTIGGRVFVKDKNTLIANYEGVFFELVKASDDTKKIELD